ncbi:PepSY domain-containing protein [Streptomyces cellulosae]|nr:PepSY domain-containing protein [Streptomyces cellulosae]
MRKRNAIAAIVVSGIMMGGAGIAMGGEAAEKSSAPGPAVSLRTDKASGTAAGADLAVNSVAAATDAVIRAMGDGRVSEVTFTEEKGRTVWKVTVDQGEGPVRVTLDAATGEITGTAAVASTTDDCATSPGAGTGDDGDDDDLDDADDQDEDDDDLDDDDDEGPDRDGAEPNK